jgi:TonB-linked SusC/RagA family outer membrane protein
MKIKTLLQFFIVQNKYTRKLFRIMRLSVISLFVFTLQLMAIGTEAQNAIMKVKSNVVTVAQLINEIEKQTDYLVVFSNREVNTQREVQLQSKSGKVSSFLTEAFGGTDISYEFENNYIILAKKDMMEKTIMAIAQQNRKHVTGAVTDQKGEPVVGANVVEKGTTNGIITDENGRFSFDVSPSSVLQISFIGYLSQDVAVGNRNNINVKLAEDTQKLDEIVVIGYGTVKKSDLTGSVSTVKNKDLTAIPSGTVLQALQGRSSGLQVKQNSGSPGGFISVRIRGANSIQGSNEPLYVIDGFPSSSTNPTVLDNSDIESVEILKDASAIAIYGSRGANGVVMITTKKGKAGTTRVNFETTMGYQTIRKKMEMMNAKEYATFYNLQRTNDGLGAYFTDEQINSFGEGFDWQNFVFKTAPIRTHSLEVTGGTDKTQFSISGNVFDQDGILKGSGYKRYSLRANMVHNISKKLILNYSTNLTRTILNDKNWGGARFGASLIGSALCAPPTLTPYKDDGSVRVLNTEYPFLSEGLINPIDNIRERKSMTKSNKVLANVSFTYKPIEDLYIKIAGGIENSDDRYDYYQTLKYLNSTGNVSVSTSQFTSVLSENTINYIKTFNKKHSISALAGFTYQDFYNTSLAGSGNGFLSDVTFTGNLAAASTPGIPSTSYTKSTLLSYLGRINYSYDNKYLFTASFRADGSSKYSDGNKWGYFPSGAIAWKAKEEGFLKDNQTISDLKVRASWGLTGSQAISAYATLNSLYSGKAVFGDALYTTFAPGTSLPGNLKWETTEQYDLGFDLGILNNRFQFTADYYVKNTRNLLNTVQLPTSLGYTNTLQNVGKIQNKGLELSVNANIFNGAFAWKVDGNIAFNKSKVKQLYGGLDILGGYEDMMIITDNLNLLREGKPVGVFYGYLKDGYDDNGSEKYKDLNGDGIINQSDKTIIGDPNPDFIYGLNSFMSYKGLELSLFFQGSQGNDIVNISAVDNTLDYGYGCNMLKEVYGNNWTPEKTDAKYPKVTRNQKMNFSDRLVENGSYLRLKNIELAYNLPLNKWKVNGIEKVRLFFSAQNLLTFTKYSGWDPEVNSQGGSNSFAQGIDHYAYPTAKSYTLGINVSF